jgi:hypothetical protein
MVFETEGSLPPTALGAFAGFKMEHYREIRKVSGLVGRPIPNLNETRLNAGRPCASVLAGFDFDPAIPAKPGEIRSARSVSVKTRPA